MYRKDFQLIAQALRDEAVHLDAPKPTPYDEMGPRDKGMYDQWSTSVLTMAKALASTNPGFDRDRFLVACGMDTNPFKSYVQARSTASYTSCGFDSCHEPATGYAPVMYGDWHAENRSACDVHGSDGSLR